MKNVLIFAAIVEAATGLALLIVPSLVGQVLLGEQLTGIAIPVARVAGIALIGLVPYQPNLVTLRTECVRRVRERCRIQ